MPNVRLSCQTISWGEDQMERFPEVFAEIAAAGFDGVEIGYRRLAATPPATMKKLLADHGLVLSGSHVGGNLADRGQARGEWGMLDQVCDYLAALDSTVLMFSGMDVGPDADLAAAVDMLAGAAEFCAGRGVSLLFHNHNWEFAGGRRIWNALLACPAIRFCPDVGWIHKAGQDVLATLEEIGKRVGTVHFKDFGSTAEGVDTVCLGAGVVPLAEVADWIETTLPGDLWVVAEQDRTDIPTAVMAKTNGVFMARVFDRQ